ncbi:hypothetical protein BS614_21870 [Paenibacillus xylanexedens]|uniref:DUF3784 domain-containing protein n=1 Tax=Paenibacillus TaxID=44249 RepID=UPI0009386BFD|nr:DUF3784 domain-containing protein [Paenibacillus xylanexedens]APO46418.1 hypothetical protein BS614_21870 [Paenibacillus xylanexedens]MCP1421544.1 ribosomal protein S27E [Paenibacillus xylanexedens]
MKKFFGILFIILSSVTILLSLILISEGTETAIISTIILFIPGVIVLVTGIKMCGRPKSHSNTNPYQHYDSNDKQDQEDQHHEKYDETPQESVAVNCSGCGAKVKVYPTLSADCEYCGTTMRIS